jgi:hypothetical protein
VLLWFSVFESAGKFGSTVIDWAFHATGKFYCSKHSIWIKRRSCPIGLFCWERCADFLHWSIHNPWIINRTLDNSRFIDRAIHDARLLNWTFRSARIVNRPQHAAEFAAQLNRAILRHIVNGSIVCRFTGEFDCPIVSRVGSEFASVQSARKFRIFCTFLQLSREFATLVVSCATFAQSIAV